MQGMKFSCRGVISKSESWVFSIFLGALKCAYFCSMKKIRWVWFENFYPILKAFFQNIYAIYEFLPFMCGLLFWLMACLVAITQYALCEVLRVRLYRAFDHTARYPSPNLSDSCLEVRAVFQHHAADLFLHPRPNGLNRIQIWTVRWPAIENCDFLRCKPTLHSVTRVCHF